MSEQNIIELLCQFTRISSLSQLCDLIYEITGNPVFISDLAHTILAYTKCVEVPDPTWQSNIVQAHLDFNTIRQDREVGSVHAGSTQSHRPVLVDDGHLPYPRIIKTLINNGQAVGVLVLTAYQRPFGANDLDLVELISSFVVPCLMRERYHISASSSALENYFIKLLDGARFSHDRVNKRLNVLGYQRKPYIYVLTMCAKGENSSDEHKPLQDLLLEFSSIPHNCIFLYNSVLVMIYGSAEPVFDWERQTPELTELLKRWQLVAGVSRQVSAMERFRDYYVQAKAILDVGLLLIRPDLYYLYDSLSSYLLFDRIPTGELELYCHQQIQELWRYDQEHGTELCVTLQVYLEQAKSLSRTAELLFIHRNTVRYRVNRCMELLDSKLEGGNETFSYILSLRILEYQNKISQNPAGVRRRSP